MVTRRIVGALLVAAGGVWMGQQARRRLQQRALLLDGLAAACAIMKSEVSFLRTPPEEMFSLLAQSGRTEAAFFRRVSVLLKEKGALAPAWQTALAEVAPLWHLAPAEQADLSRLGEALGRYDLEGAVAHLSVAADRLAAFAKEAHRVARTDGQLQLTLWSLAGCFVGILLL